MHFFLSGLAVLILITGIVIADGEYKTALPIQGTMIQLTSGEFIKTSPVITDRYIVWEDFSNDIKGRDFERNSDINGYDWYWNKPLVILQEPSRQAAPAISGSQVVWQDNRRTNWDIWMHDIKTGYDLDICRLYADQINPDIDEWTVVWEDSRSYSTDIYGYDLIRLKEFPISTDPGEQTDPRVCGPVIVWSDNRNGNPDIYGYTTETNKEFPVCRNTNVEKHPDISGDIIVWEDYREGKSQIYSYSIITGEEKILSPGPGGQYHPRISENCIVFEDDRSGDLDVYLYNIETEQLYRVTSGSADQILPDIYQDRIVWMEEHKTAIPSSDIYLLQADFTYINGDAYNVDNINVEDTDCDAPLTAAFTSDTREGIIPCNVSFSDLSPGNPDAWIWRFGDDGVSIDKNPYHIYTHPGTYTVSLTARNGAVSNTKVITGYITVTEPLCEDIPLHEGWNLFSVPDYPLEGYDTMQIFGQIPSEGHSLFGFDAYNKTWIRLAPDDKISPYKAFFLFSAGETDLRMCYENDGSEYDNPALCQGWNLVSFRKTKEDEGITDTATGLTPPDGWEFFIGYNATDQRYTEVQTPDGEILPPAPDPGLGYWIFMREQASSDTDNSQSLLTVL